MDVTRKRAAHVALVGPMGAGKSSLAHVLASRFGLRAVDADECIEQAAGLRIAQLFEREGEAAFRQREREVLSELLAGEGCVIATGGGAVLDAATRRDLAARAVVLWLQADVDTQLARLAGDTARPLLATSDPAARLRDLAAVREPLYRELADIELDTSGLSPEDVATRAIAALEAHRRRGEAA